MGRNAYAQGVCAQPARVVPVRAAEEVAAVGQWPRHRRGPQGGTVGRCRRAGRTVGCVGGGGAVGMGEVWAARAVVTWTEVTWAETKRAMAARAEAAWVVRAEVARAEATRAEVTWAVATGREVREAALAQRVWETARPLLGRRASLRDRGQDQEAEEWRGGWWRERGRWRRRRRQRRRRRRRHQRRQAWRARRGAHRQQRWWWRWQERRGGREVAVAWWERWEGWERRRLWRQRRRVRWRWRVRWLVHVGHGTGAAAAAPASSVWCRLPARRQ